jgi:hypothetical protein
MVASAVVVLAVVVAAAPVRRVEALDLSDRLVHDPTPRPLGPILVFGDSVLRLGTQMLVDELAADGWGPILARGVDGGRASDVCEPTIDRFRLDRWIEQLRAQGTVVPRHVIVHLGANDSGDCANRPDLAEATIRTILDLLGPDVRVWWPMTNRFYTHERQATMWNGVLAGVAASDERLADPWDWPAVLASGQVQTYDGTHPNGLPHYAIRAALMSDDVTAKLARATRVGGGVALPAPSSAPTRLVPRPPERVADTRVSGRPAGSAVVVDLSARLPGSADAVVVNVTATQASAAGFLTAAPCDAPPPLASNVNYRPGEDRASSAIVPLGASRSVCVTSSSPTDVVVDLQGHFEPGAALGLVPIDPVRLVDRTVAAGEVVRVPVGAPAAALGLTVDAADAPGFVTAAPCGGAPPEVSNVNFGARDPVAGSAIVPSGAGEVCVVASSAARLVVDLFGTFTVGGASYVPVAPTRLLDTRDGTGGWAPVHGAAQTLDVAAAPSGAVAATGSLTIVGPLAPGFLVAHPCSTSTPPTSNVNAAAGRDAATGATVRVDGSGRTCLRASAATHTVVDLHGWWIDP